MERRLDALRTHAQVVLLDGGLAIALEERGHDLSDELWSARLLLDAPEEVVAAHRSFLEVGAEVVTTASYQLAERSLRAAGRDPTSATPLLTRSVELAREAATAHLADAGAGAGRRPLIAASLGPFGAVLGDGAEYRGDYGLTEAELTAFHAPRVAALLEAGPDLLACETLPAGAEVAAITRLLRGSGQPAWVSITPGHDGTTTPEGQPLAEAVAPLADVEEVIAVGVNCCPPERVLPALSVLRPLDLPLVTYPNVGARWDTERQTWRAEDPTTTTGADELTAWVDRGARWVGGCCGTTPERLARLAAVLDEVRTP